MFGFDAISTTSVSDIEHGSFFTAVIAEAITASDSFSQITTPTTIWLTSFAQEVLYADPDTISSVTSVATETMLAEVNTVSVTSVAVETLLISLLLGGLNESVVASDAFTITNFHQHPIPKPPRPIRSTNLQIKQQPYTPVDSNRPDWKGWNQQMARAINGVMAGGQNVTLAEFVLDANKTSTILYATQIGATSVITLSPITESAANEKIWISNQKQGQATINHANSAAVDRKFRVQIIA